MQFHAKSFVNVTLLTYFCSVKRSITTYFSTFLVIFYITTFCHAYPYRQKVQTDSTHSTILTHHASNKQHNLLNDGGRGYSFSREKSTSGEVTPRKGMITSTFPIKLRQLGSALCITSEQKQLLPIYTRGGTFYLSMQLHKGENWLNGLPKGRYLINYQLVNIP